eukprot:TRINITY_DN17042_c0_g1_i1.p1 TRINITY_DN17042_c0_g1~~TRINITY_DN17042_c0_g1_i1.p1  ORF type:complete len:429 (+),score=90.50 TRINITY_DN17042_c0_g1_i1:73-1359(+)
MSIAFVSPIGGHLSASSSGLGAPPAFAGRGVPEAPRQRLENHAFGRQQSEPSSSSSSAGSRGATFRPGVNGIGRPLLTAALAVYALRACRLARRGFGFAKTSWTRRSRGKTTIASAGGGGAEKEEGGLPTWCWKIVALLLIMTTATNFANTKNVMAQPGLTPELFAVARFTLAALALLPFAWRVSSRQVFWRAFECGFWVALGYIGQAIGLITTTAAKSCFICSLNAVFVALVVGVMSRKFDLTALIAALLAASGVGFLELSGSHSVVIGDLISLAQPIGFGMGYIRIAETMKKHPEDALPLVSIELGVVAIASFMYYFAANGGLPPLAPILASAVAMKGILWAGLISTAAVCAIETFVFCRLDAPTASVIFTTEPLWATLFAWYLIGEKFSRIDAIGGALVVAACLLKELPPGMLPWNRGKAAAVAA